MDIIHLAQDELEALHLCDGEGKSQIEAGICMGISRGTVQRLLAGARRKVAQALVGQMALAISGNMAGNEESTVPEGICSKEKKRLVVRKEFLDE